MEKIFLSHSSSNKDYVRPIFDYFGGDRCVFDEMTFEAGMKTLQEIFNGIDETDIFVFFISNEALESEWVKKEITKAKQNLDNDIQKLSQIFPIIIDDSITYEDERIPDFLKNGFGAYNLRHILNYKVACKKIENQLTKLRMERDLSLDKKLNFFYGRDLEKKCFKENLDERDENGKLKHIKCLVVSGIDGIGRKAYARAALKDSEIIERYYFPMSIELLQNDTIEDLIMKLSCDLGLGEYTYDDLDKFGDMDSKIEILVDLLNMAQKYREIFFIEDEMCIVKSSEMAYWFEKVLEKIGRKITIVIITRIRLNSFHYRKNKNIFEITLQNLEPSDTFGFLRGYSKINGIPFEEEDIDFFSEILSGYPLQIQYCVELAKNNGSIEYVKNHSYMIADMPSANSAKMLDIVIEDDLKKEYKGLLSLLAELGTMPVNLMEYIIKNNPVYGRVLNRIKMFTVCNTVGTAGEYLRLNAVIRDYVLRTGFNMTEDIRKFLNKNTEEFAKRIEDPEYMNYLSFSEFSYYIKENLKNNVSVPDKFLYATVYVKSIIELYNERKYTRVLELVRDMKQSRVFINSAQDIKNIIQFYYCCSLARLKKIEFDAEVSYFRNESSYQQYNFLKGFNYRMHGKYSMAEHSYLNVLKKNPRHDKARRELVLIYTNMQDYGAALDLAEQNYRDYPENMYQMQAYFDCLIYRSSLSDEQKSDIEEILSTAESIYRTSTSEIYFQLKAKYIAFIEKDKDKALQVLNDGLDQFKNSFYIHKDYFDICRRYGDRRGMESAYSNLKKIANMENAKDSIALLCRNAYLSAAQGKTKVAIELMLKTGSSNLTESAIENIMIHVEKVINKQR